MKNENISGSTEKLQDALGLIKDEYLIEAYETELSGAEADAARKEASADAPGKEPIIDAARKEAADDNEKNSSLKWKKVMRWCVPAVGIAAAVIIIVTLVILPNRTADYTKSEMSEETYAAAAEEAAGAYEAAVAEEEMVAETYAEDINAAEAAAEAGNYNNEKDAIAAGGAAESPAAVNDVDEDEIPLSSLEGIRLDGAGDEMGIAVQYYDSIDTPAGHELYSGTQKSLIFKDAGQFRDYIGSAEIISEEMASGSDTEYNNNSNGAGERRLTDLYNEDFFKAHNLVVTAVEVSSGAYRVDYMYTEQNGNEAVQHYSVYRPNKEPGNDNVMITMDMAYWLIISEVPKEITEASAVEDEYDY